MLDPDAAPLYWQEPGMLLDLFDEMAERNLFLVQHLQARLMLCPVPMSPKPASLRHVLGQACWMEFRWLLYSCWEDTGVAQSAQRSCLAM